MPTGGQAASATPLPVAPPAQSKGRLSVRRNSHVAACGSLALGPKRRFRPPTAGEPSVATLFILPGQHKLPQPGEVSSEFFEHCAGGLELAFAPRLFELLCDPAGWLGAQA